MCFMCCRFRQDVHLVRKGCCWQWAVGGLGSGTRIQICRKWFKNRLLGALLLLPFHCPPQLTMGRLLHFAVYNAPPLWCQSGTLPLDSLPFSEHSADWQALKFISVGCQISD